jgi:hypothetical protein
MKERPIPLGYVGRSTLAAYGRKDYAVATCRRIENEAPGDHESEGEEKAKAEPA